MPDPNFAKQPLAPDNKGAPHNSPHSSPTAPSDNHGIRHIAIIMDGNRRWARKNNLPPSAGHKEGAKLLRRITLHCKKRHIPYLTVYAFSTENWKRPKEEVSFLFDLIPSFLKTELPVIMKEGIRLNFIGDAQALSFPVRTSLEFVKAKSAKNSSLDLTIALNYSGKNEILRAVNLAKKSGISHEELTEEKFRSFLDKPDLPDPDIIIRTGGEERLSNFLLFQAVNSYFYITKKFWPEFNEDCLDHAIASFSGK